MRNYYQQVTGVDYAVGMLREELERQGIADNTVIIFTSDNGYFNGAHGLAGKALAYEEGSKVPLIIMDPRGKVKGQRCRSLTATVDIAPTLLDLAGLPVPDNMDGFSLMPLLEDSSERVRTSLPLFQAWGSFTWRF